LSKAKQKLRDAARVNARFIHSVTEQFERPLISIHKRLTYIKEDIAANITEEQTKHITIMGAEIERLIHHFHRLPEQSTNEVAAMPHPQSAVGRDVAESSDNFYRRSEHKIKTLIARAQDLWARS
jgi:hypothetical protein